MSTCEALAEEVPTDSVKQYKLWLLEARQMREDMRRQLGRRVYRMMRLLLQVFNDQEFRADNGNADDFTAGAVLDDFVLDDTGLEFLQLRAMMERYPGEAAWISGRLQRMYRDMMQERQNRGAERARREKSPALTRAEYDAVARTAARQKVMLTAANDQLEAAHEQLEAAKVETTVRLSEIEVLRERVAALQVENERLRTKVIALGGDPDD